MTEKYEYCSTVPRTFVQDCSCAYLVKLCLDPLKMFCNCYGIYSAGSRAQKAEKMFLRPPALPYLRVWMTAPRPPLIRRSESAAGSNSTR